MRGLIVFLFFIKSSFAFSGIPKLIIGEIKRQFIEVNTLKPFTEYHIRIDTNQCENFISIELFSNQTKLNTWGLKNSISEYVSSFELTDFCRFNDSLELFLLYSDKSGTNKFIQYNLEIDRKPNQFVQLGNYHFRDSIFHPFYLNLYPRISIQPSPGMSGCTNFIPTYYNFESCDITLLSNTAISKYKLTKTSLNQIENNAYILIDSIKGSRECDTQFFNPFSGYIGSTVPQNNIYRIKKEFKTDGFIEFKNNHGNLDSIKLTAISLIKCGAITRYLSGSINDSTTIVLFFDTTGKLLEKRTKNANLAFSEIYLEDGSIWTGNWLQKKDFEDTTNRNVWFFNDIEKKPVIYLTDKNLYSITNHINDGMIQTGIWTKSENNAPQMHVEFSLTKNQDQIFLYNINRYDPTDFEPINSTVYTLSNKVLPIKKSKSSKF